jgi:hypothetical protein
MFSDLSLHHASSSRIRRQLRLEALEARLTPAVPAFAVGQGAGGFPLVNVYSDTAGFIRQFNAYNLDFRGGVRVATADINGDGIKDTITAPGPGGPPEVRVFDGNTGVLFRIFNAYDPRFAGGVFVAAGDVNSDGRADIVTGAGAGGGPHVRAFSGATGLLLVEFFAYAANFRGGVSVAAGDMTFDNFAEIITGAGIGGGPHVRVFDPRTGAGIASFFPFDPNNRFGVNVASLPTGVFGSNAIVAVQGRGGTPDVRVFDSRLAPVTAFFAADPSFRGGINVGAASVGQFATFGTLTGLGLGGFPIVSAFNFPLPTLQFSFVAFDPSFLGGVFVG